MPEESGKIPADTSAASFFDPLQLRLPNWPWNCLCLLARWSLMSLKRFSVFWCAKLPTFIHVWLVRSTFRGVVQISSFAVYWLWFVLLTTVSFVSQTFWNWWASLRCEGFWPLLEYIFVGMLPVWKSTSYFVWITKTWIKWCFVSRLCRWPIGKPELTKVFFVN